MNRTHKLFSTLAILAFMFAMLGASPSVVRAAGANRPLALQPAFRLIGDCAGRYMMNDGVIDLGVTGVWMGGFEQTATQVCTFHMSYPVDSGDITFWWWAADPGLDSFSLAFDGATMLTDPALGSSMQSQSFAAGTLVTDLTITNPPSAGNGSVFIFCFPGGCLEANDPSAGDLVAPQVTVPGDMTLMASTTSGAVATFSASATDETSPVEPGVSCEPASGSSMPIGTTTVTCSATDDAGNTGTASFNVTVVTIPASGANLLTNPYFETALSSVTWKSSTTANSGQPVWDCTVSLSPNCSLKFKGVGASRSMSQTITTSGKAGETFQFGVWNKALSLPSTGIYSLQVTFLDSAGRAVLKRTISLSNGTHNFQLASGSVTTTSAYAKITFTITLNKTSGSAWLDDAFLIRNP